MYVASSADSEICDKNKIKGERRSSNEHKKIYKITAITESLMAMTGMADNPELIACVES